MTAHTTININDLGFPPNFNGNDNGNDCPYALPAFLLEKAFPTLL